MQRLPRSQNLFKKTFSESYTVLLKLPANSATGVTDSGRTIDFILDYTYHNDRVTRPKIPEATLKQLLTICTKEGPFQHVDGRFF